MFYHNTKAQSLIHSLVKRTDEISLLTLLGNFGAVLVAKIANLQFLNLESGTLESGEMSSEISQYQFPDGSLVWYTSQQGVEFIQLRGVYAGARIHTSFITFGEAVIYIYPDRGQYPENWNRSVEDLDLTMRVVLVLRDKNIRYVAELISMSERDFLDLPNMGPKSLATTKNALEEHGLSFKTNVGDWRRLV